MTRAKKLERIQKYRPRLYQKLVRYVPKLVENPDNASQEDIELYNTLIDEVAWQDSNNITFKKNFSF